VTNPKFSGRDRRDILDWSPGQIVLQYIIPRICVCGYGVAFIHSRLSGFHAEVQPRGRERLHHDDSQGNASPRSHHCKLVVFAS
jgi:hypothetical protein